MSDCHRKRIQHVCVCVCEWVHTCGHMCAGERDDPKLHNHNLETVFQLLKNDTFLIPRQAIVRQMMKVT